MAGLVLLGNIPGIFLLKNVNPQTIKVIFGFVIAAIGIEMFLRESKEKKSRKSKVVLGIIGLLSGVLCGLFGIGALLAAYVSRVTDNNSAFRANICAVFLIENTFRIIVYITMGILTFDILKQAAALVPAMLAGLFLGIKSGQALDEKTVKKTVIIMLLFSGIALIVNNIRI